MKFGFTLFGFLLSFFFGLVMGVPAAPHDQYWWVSAFVWSLFGLSFGAVTDICRVPMHSTSVKAPVPADSKGYPPIEETMS